MTQPSTLHSRLRVLVARTFRAEQVYSSMRNSSNGQTSHLSELSDMANDIRAKEWQRGHHQLRTALNDLLDQKNQRLLSTEVNALAHRFQGKFEEVLSVIETQKHALIDSTKRQEFAQGLKFSLELIRLNASAQANKVIADELFAVLDSSNRTAEPPQVSSPDETFEEEQNYQVAAVAGGSREGVVRTNVITLHRKLSSGGSFRRR